MNVFLQIIKDINFLENVIQIDQNTKIMEKYLSSYGCIPSTETELLL